MSHLWKFQSLFEAYNWQRFCFYSQQSRKVRFNFQNATLCQTMNLRFVVFCSKMEVQGRIREIQIFSYSSITLLFTVSAHISSIPRIGRYFELFPCVVLLHTHNSRIHSGYQWLQVTKKHSQLHNLIAK